MPPIARSSVRRRARANALGLSLGLTASLGLVALAPALSNPAQAEPPADCDQPFPVADLVEGQTVNGLTVSKGTTPEPFTGEVLGVLESGIAPGLDMIMIELDSPAIQKVGGIWQGMSGSPVYDDATGDLIGAVAYGLAYGTTPVAGVTPFEDMDKYLPEEPEAIEVGRADARTIAQRSDVTVEQALQGFEQLPVPMGISGLSSNRLNALDDIEELDDKAYLPDNPYLGSSASADAAPIETIVAGGSLAAVQSYGDVTFAGVGTVTSVCHGRVAGFGHPMAFAGETSYGLGAAEVVYVQEDPVWVPFKVANVGEIGGTITDDRLAGIYGDLGPTPATVPFTSDVTYEGNQRDGVTEVVVPDALAAVSFYGSLGNHDVVVDGIQEGTEVGEWRIEGIDEDGETFELTFDDRITSTWDISVEASWGLADVLWFMNYRFPDVEITSVTNTGEVSDGASSYRLKRIERLVRGEWVRVGDDRVKAKGGTTLHLRAVLVSGAETVTVPVDVFLPKKLAGERGEIDLTGGEWDYPDIWGADTVAEMKEALDAAPRNDQILTEVTFGRRGNKYKTVDLSEAQTKVIERSRDITVVVTK